MGRGKTRVKNSTSNGKRHGPGSAVGAASTYAAPIKCIIPEAEPETERGESSPVINEFVLSGRPASCQPRSLLIKLPLANVLNTDWWMSMANEGLLWLLYSHCRLPRRGGKPIPHCYWHVLSAGWRPFFFSFPFSLNCSLRLWCSQFSERRRCHKLLTVWKKKKGCCHAVLKWRSAEPISHFQLIPLHKDSKSKGSAHHFFLFF